jgi:hypothetical protein
MELSLGKLEQQIGPSVNSSSMQVLNLTALDPDTEYSVIINASNMAGSTTVHMDFKTLPVNPNAPAKPMPPVLDGSTENSLLIKWEQGDISDATFVWMLEASDANGAVLRRVYMGRQNSFQLGNLQGNATYGVRVRGRNVYGEGQPSDTLLFTTQATNKSLPHAYVSDDGKFRVSWTISGEEIEFTITAATTGWLGFGIGLTPTMFNTDMLMGGFDGVTGTGYLNDRWSLGRDTPRIDMQQDVSLVSASETDTSTTISVKRLLITADKEEDVAITNSNMYLLWAYGSEDSLSSTNLPTHIERGAVLVNFVSGSTDGVTMDLLYNSHGALQFIAWMILIPAGSIVARYHRITLGIWWFRLHVILQVSGLVFSSVGFAIGFAAVDASRTVHFANAHSYVGFFLYIFLLLQSGLGLFSHLKYNPARKATPVYPDKVHRWTGMSLMGLAFLAVFLGLYYQHVRVGAWLLGAIALAYCLLTLLVWEYF